MESPAIRQRIAKRVKPFMLRRTKDQVARDLPAKLETVLSCELEGRQKQLYDAELAQARRAMLKIQSPEEFEQQRFSIFRGLTRLRQICCHPGLINDGGADWPSAKLRLLEEHLDQLVQEGHRVLVFSQWVTMLDIIRQRLQQHDYPFLYLTGSTENRAEMVQKFRDADGSMIFLLSLRAAGAGLNLSEARYVFLFDPWWNPAVEAQAVDRAHRIGTRHNVLTYRLCAHNTIEHKMLKLKERKHELARDVINTGNIGDFQELSFENIRQLLE
jgi:SNF2 family DNA or RNA helicase